MDRALRRHHRNRIKQKVKGYRSGSLKDNPVGLGFTATTPHPRSGPCCGNPRKHFNDLTKQEKIHDLEFELNA